MRVGRKARVYKQARSAQKVETIFSKDAAVMISVPSRKKLP